MSSDDLFLDEENALFGFSSASRVTFSSDPRSWFACQTLDKILSPAIRPGHVVEVAGEAGSGKTQFIVSLCARGPRVSNPNSRVVVLSTESAFPVDRLKHMASGPNQKTVMDRVLVENIPDFSSLVEAMESAVPKLTKTVDIDLLVVDSVAAPLRGGTGASDTSVSPIERSRQIHRLGSGLFNLAVTLNCPVVVTNQVTAVFDQTYECFGRHVVPCFGLSFVSYVHTRIFINRTDLVVTSLPRSEDPGSSLVKPDARLRTVTVDFSPILSSGKPHHFVVSRNGIKGVRIKSQ